MCEIIDKLKDQINIVRELLSEEYQMSLEDQDEDQEFTIKAVNPILNCTELSG